MITRREFFKLGGLSLILVMTPKGLKVVKAEELKRYSPRLWLNLSKDNILTVLINKSEMGQGVYTGIAQIVADELDFPWERVRVAPAPAGKYYVDPIMGIQLTGGSTSIRNMFDFMRYVGASMREMLLEAGSRVLGVPKNKLKAKLGYVIYKDKKIPYGDLTDIAMKLPVPEEPRLKSPEEFIYIGKSVPRIDLDDKINGNAEFGIDIFFEDQIYAVIERPPSFGSYAKTFSLKKEKGITHVFKVGKGVAVCGKDPYSVLKAREKLRVEWSRSPIEDMDTEKMKEYYRNLLKKRGLVARNDGNFERAYRNAKKKIELTYTLPYLYHACMETMSCTVMLTKDECIIYVPTQSQTSVLKHARRITGLPESRIRIITTYLGGGFGRKSNSEFVVEALKIARKVKKPVKLFYTREDDIKAGWYRPMCSAILKGSVDENGKPEAFFFKIAVPAVFEWARGRKIPGVDPASVSGVANMFYEIPNVRVEFVKSELPIPVWFWRSVGHSHNAYILETFIDALAELGDKDPAELRLELLEFHPRAQRVIEKVLEMSEWHKGAKYGQALGLAYHYSFGSHVAQVADVSLENGKVKVHKVYCAVDLGPIVVNPDLVVQQMESGIIMGISAFLYEGVKFEKGGAKNLNFDTYRIMRIENTPEIEVEIVKSDGPMGGIGEPGVPPAAPAVANAIRKITGKVITELPYYG